MKPFKNAYDAIKRLLENIKKSLTGEPKDKPSGKVVDGGLDELGKSGMVDTAQFDDVDEIFEKVEAEKAEAKKKQGDKSKSDKAKVDKTAAEAKGVKDKAAKEKEEKKAREDAEAKAQKARAEEAAARKKAAKERAETEKRVAAEMAREQAEAQKKYEEEGRKRAERAAKREAEEKKAEQRAARRQMETESSTGKTVVDPVTGETVPLGSLPAEATFLKKYEKLSTTGDDVLVAINSILKHPDMPKNIVVLGRNGFGTVKVGEDFARSFFSMGIVKSEKIAKVKAKSLNKMGLEKLAGLKGGCLIIENAGLVNPDKLVEVIKNSSPEENDYVVILTGEIDSLAAFFEDNKEIVDYFIYLIDIHKIKERGMVTLAKGYVKEKGYTADKPVYDKFKGALSSMEVGNIDRFIDMIDAAIAKCDSREKIAGEEKKEIHSEDCN